MNPARDLGAAAWLALALAPAAAAEVIFVVEGRAQARKAEALSAEGVRVVAFERRRLADPIVKGRLLSSLHTSELIVAVGTDACGWLGRETENAAIQCVPPYDPAQVLDFARASGWRRVAAVHTAGYERLLTRLRALARERGLTLQPLRVVGRRDLPRLSKELAASDAIWVLGDALLTQDSVFSYLVELSLTHRVPLIAPEHALVSHGAFLGAQSEPAAVLRYAAAVAGAAARGAPPPEPAPPGRLLVNEVLTRKWGGPPPGSAR